MLDKLQKALTKEYEALGVPTYKKIFRVVKEGNYRYQNYGIGVDNFSEKHTDWKCHHRGDAKHEPGDLGVIANNAKIEMLRNFLEDTMIMQRKKSFAVYMWYLRAGYNNKKRLQEHADIFCLHGKLRTTGWIEENEKTQDCMD